MSTFITVPLTIPPVIASMKGIEDLLSESGHQITSLYVGRQSSDKVDENFELTLSHLQQPVKVCFIADACKALQKPSDIKFDCAKVVEFLGKLSANASNDFDLLAQALASSFEVPIGDLLAFDKPTYAALTKKAHDIAERAKASNSCSCESKHVSVYIAPFDNDFLHAVTRILRCFERGKPAVVYCSSHRLMLPLFTFTKCVIVAGAPTDILTFLPINKVDRKGSYLSSIQMIMQPADLDSATRAIVKGASYQAGTTSWRPSVVLVEQNYEKDFHNKVKSLVSGSTQSVDGLDQNSHLHNTCLIPSYLKAGLEEFLKQASSDGGEVVRPSEATGPIFVFGLTPASAMLEKAKRFPLGPFSIVLPFRTVNEGLKLSKYFNDRETRVLGAGEYVSPIPKSASIWTENSGLSLQVLAKLHGYTVQGVNSDVHRLAASFYISECSAFSPCIHMPGLPVPVDEAFGEVDANAAAELSKAIAAAEKLSEAWKKIPLDRRLAAFSAAEDLKGIVAKLKQLNCDSVAQLAPVCPHVTLGDQINSAFSNQRLCLLRKWQEPCGTVTVVLKSPELLPSLMEVVLASVVLGNVVLLARPKSSVANEEVAAFCDTVNGLVARSCPQLSSLGPVVRIKQMEVCSKGISTALSSLGLPGVMCISAPEAEVLTDDLSVRNLCRLTSVFWSVGGDLFAN